MTVSEPPHRTIQTDPDTAAGEPEIIYTEVRDTGSTAAWWVGGLVAIVAILSIVFMVSHNPNSDAQVANAVEQGRLQGALESSQSTLSETQNAARQAAQSAAISASNTAVAANAANSAKTAAQSASDAATNVSATVTDTAVSEPAPGQ